MLVAYDPNDKEQSSFLAALSKGEGGGGTGSGWFGGAAFQFPAGAWDSLAQRFGLDASKRSDQNAGAYYLAQDVYARATGRSLDADLDAGETSYLEGALRSIWPSVQGNQSNPRGLVAAMGSARVPTPGTDEFADYVRENNAPNGLGTDVASFIQRFGLIIVGGIIVLVALWNLLANSGAVPSPGKVAKAAANSL